MAISIFGPDSGCMAVAFLVLDLRTVWALEQIFSVLKVQRSHLGPTGRQMTGDLWPIWNINQQRWRVSTSTDNLAKPDEQVVYPFVKLGGQPRL